MELDTRSGLEIVFHVRLIDTNFSVIFFSLHISHTEVLVPCIGADMCASGYKGLMGPFSAECLQRRGGGNVSGKCGRKGATVAGI